jgi:hypothetical protein
MKPRVTGYLKVTCALSSMDRPQIYRSASKMYVFGTCANTFVHLVGVLLYGVILFGVCMFEGLCLFTDTCSRLA